MKVEFDNEAFATAILLTRIFDQSARGEARVTKRRVSQPGAARPPVSIISCADSSLIVEAYLRWRKPLKDRSERRVGYEKKLDSTASGEINGTTPYRLRAPRDSSSRSLPCGLAGAKVAIAHRPSTKVHGIKARVGAHFLRAWSGALSFH